MKTYWIKKIGDKFVFGMDIGELDEIFSGEKFDDFIDAMNALTEEIDWQKRNYPENTIRVKINVKF